MSWLSFTARPVSVTVFPAVVRPECDEFPGAASSQFTTRKEREMRIKVNGVELCVETFGNPADPPVLLVGVTMLSWPDELCAALAGRYVVRYDLRDAGQST